MECVSSATNKIRVRHSNVGLGVRHLRGNHLLAIPIQPIMQCVSSGADKQLFGQIIASCAACKNKIRGQSCNAPVAPVYTFVCSQHRFVWNVICCFGGHSLPNRAMYGLHCKVLVLGSCQPMQKARQARETHYIIHIRRGVYSWISIKEIRTRDTYLNNFHDLSTSGSIARASP